MVYIILTVIVGWLCFADLYCKSWIEKHLRKGDREKLGRSPFELRRVHNKGFAMNLGDKKLEYVRIVSAIICVVMAIWALLVWKKETCPVKRIATAFLLAGAISNTYDRLKREYVVDYIGIKTKCEKLRRITFNLADVFIFIGAVTYAIAEVFGD